MASFLSHLNLKTFRNIETLDFEFHPRLNFFFGDNAQGKTSLLEAVFFLSELRSFRSQDLDNLIFKGFQGAYLDAALKVNTIQHEIKISLKKSGKEVWLNGKTPKPYRKLSRLFPMVLFTPDSVRLFRASPSERRGYFDHLFSLLSESYALSVAEYVRVCRQKQGLMEQIQMRGLDHSSQIQLETWNEKLSGLGAAITFDRFLFSNELSEKLSPYFYSLSGQDWKSRFYYQPYFQEISLPKTPTEIEQALLKEMNRRFKEEVERGQILVGPHRDDWNFLLEEFRLKEQGSQGQHRVATAALKLAEVGLLIHKGMSPIALFDDLLSELDLERTKQMLTLLGKVSSQVFLTSTTPLGLDLAEFEGRAFQIKKGRVLS